MQHPHRAPFTPIFSLASSDLVGQGQETEHRGSAQVEARTASVQADHLVQAPGAPSPASLKFPISKLGAWQYLAARTM